MQLLFKQRMFSWFDSYDIYNEFGETVFTVKGQFAWGKLLKIFDANDRPVGTLKQVVLSWLPKFEMYVGDEYSGCIKKEISFLRPKFSVDCNGWRVEGNITGWDYQIIGHDGSLVATVSKQIWKLTDTYVIDVANPNYCLVVLMLVLAIDAEKAINDD